MLNRTSALMRKNQKKKINKQTFYFLVRNPCKQVVFISTFCDHLHTCIGDWISEKNVKCTEIYSFTCTVLIVLGGKGGDESRKTIKTQSTSSDNFKKIFDACLIRMRQLSPQPSPSPCR